MTKNSLFLFIGIFFLLSSCSVLSPVNTGQNTSYVLKTIPAVKTKQPSYKTILVTLPDANGIYNTNRMVYSLNPYQVAYFAKNNWAETPSRMLQSLIVQTLQNTHYFRAISSNGFETHYRLVLNTQLLELQQNFFSAQSEVTVRLRAQLIQSDTGRVIAAKEFYASRPAPQNNPYGGVLAANQATAAILRQLADFVTRE